MWGWFSKRKEHAEKWKVLLGLLLSRRGYEKVAVGYLPELVPGAETLFSICTDAMAVASALGDLLVAERLIDICPRFVPGNAVIFRYSLLISAVEGGSVAVVERVLQTKPNVNRRNIHGENALSTAVKNDDVEVTKLLLARGASIKPRRRQRYRLLHYAVEHGSLTMIRALAAAGCDLNEGWDLYNPLTRALRKANSLPKVKTLLELGADPNLQDAVGGAPLQYAALEDKSRFVASLMKAGADASRGSWRWGNPLELAVENRRMRVVRELLNNGALPKGRWSSEKPLETAFHKALRGEQVSSNITAEELQRIKDEWLEIIAMLVEAGAVLGSTTEFYARTGAFNARPDLKALAERARANKKG